VTELRRQLGLLDATMINVGTIIASAIFIVPSTIAQQLHASGLTILVWVVGGAVSLLGALAVSELGAALPKAGGQYVYLSEAYGPVWGYLYGWTGGIVINPASIAAIAVAFATYVEFFVPLGAPGVKALAIGSIAGLTVLNCLGVRPGTLTQNVLTSLKIGLLMFLIVIGFVLPGGSLSNFTPIWPDASRSLGDLIGPFGVAMVAVLWAYDGWIEVCYVGGEVRDPGQNLPRAVVLSTLITIALFCLVTASYTYVLSPAKMAQSPLVASDAAQVTLGRAGAALVAATILVSTLGANNGIVLTAARIPYAMARDGLLPKWLGGVHPRFLTPTPALIVQALVAIALTLGGTYDQLFTYVVFAQFLFYAMACAAVVRLRHRAPDLARPYRTWGYPVTPIVFIAFATWLVANTVVEQPMDSAVGAALMIAGLPVYFWRSRQLSAISRQPTPADTTTNADG
jgi:basic amino acid/polyamine antiporter, APA family